LPPQAAGGRHALNAPRIEAAGAGRKQEEEVEQQERAAFDSSLEFLYRRKIVTSESNRENSIELVIPVISCKPKLKNFKKKMRTGDS
jgi:hypothetical protein